MRLPTIALDAVYHIGTLDPADLGRNSGSGSLEGRNLSVSLCPNAWQEIARLGGYPLHRLTRQGGTFLDAHAATRDPELRAAMLDWAGREGLASLEPRWKAWTFDEESEEWMYVLAASREDAIADVESLTMLEWGEDEIPAPEGLAEPIEEVFAVVATEALNRLTGMDLGPNDDAMDGVAMAWAILALPEAGVRLDGLWWREDHDPLLLSAPRGCVFPEAVPAWDAFPAAFDDVDDGGELSAMPGTEWTEAGAAPRP